MKANANEQEIKEHLAGMTNIAVRIESADPLRKLTDMDLATRTLLSLPEEFEPVKLMRLSGDAKHLTPKIIRDDVVALVKRRSVMNDGGTVFGGAAMAANKTTNKKR